MKRLAKLSLITKFIFISGLVMCFGAAFVFLNENIAKAEKSSPNMRHFAVDQAKHGPATIVLQDGYELPAAYETERPGGTVRPTSLATADFDVDGYPDLVSGYATVDGGYLIIQRGNPEAFAPMLPENVQAVGESRFPVSVPAWFAPATRACRANAKPLRRRCPRPPAEGACARAGGRRSGTGTARDRTPCA